MNEGGGNDDARVVVREVLTINCSGVCIVIGFGRDVLWLVVLSLGWDAVHVCVHGSCCEVHSSDIERFVCCSVSLGMSCMLRGVVMCMEFPPVPAPSPL